MHESRRLVTVYLIIFNYFSLECPAEFRDTEFRRNFAEFFPGIPPELSYGIPYFTSLPPSLLTNQQGCIIFIVCRGI